MKVVLATAPRSMGEIDMAGLPFLGIAYIAAYLEKYGNHKVTIVDSHSDDLSEDETVKRILGCDPDAAGFTATAHNRLQAISVIKKLKEKKPSLTIIVGGPFFSLTDKNALEVVPEIDAVIKREGEVTTKEFLDAWPDRNKLKDVLGITYRDLSGRVLSNPDRSFMKDWTSLPNPAWHLYDLSKYVKTIHGTDFRTVGIISARGCPNACTFCCNAAYGKQTLRLRDPKSFVDEVEFLNKKHGFIGFNIWDDTLTVNRDHIFGICREIIKRGLEVKWYARARVNTVDEEMIDIMKKAGCVRISFGIESGSPRILKLIKKGITIDQARKAVEISSRAGLIVSLNFIVNLPEETFEDTRMTVDVMKELKKFPNTTVSYGFGLVYPGTEMEYWAKEKGVLPKDFSWNSPYKYPKYKITNEDPSVPHMEWPGREIEVVKAFMMKNLNTKKGLFKKGWKKIKKIRSFEQFKDLCKAAVRYTKARTMKIGAKVEGAKANH